MFDSITAHAWYQTYIKQISLPALCEPMRQIILWTKIKWSCPKILMLITEDAWWSSSLIMKEIINEFLNKGNLFSKLFVSSNCQSVQTRALSLSLNPVFIASLFSFIAGILKWCLRANRCSSLFLSQLGRLLPPHQWVFPLQSSCHQSCPHHLRNQMKSSPILCFHFSGAQTQLQLQFSQSESWIKDRFASFWILCHFRKAASSFTTLQYSYGLWC